MPPITSLATKLQRDFPEIRFAPGETFAWQPQEKAVRYVAASGDLPALLHETAHAQLGHHEYVRDIALLRMEREAWQYAKETLAAKYAVEITEDDIEEALDTYRDWLHARSTCPHCEATGLQTRREGEYSCPACSTEWRANEARTCALRRYILT